MQVTIEDNQLVIRAPIAETLQPSKTGKTLIVATSRGNKTFDEVQVQGKPVTIGLNAYVKRDS